MTSSTPHFVTTTARWTLRTLGRAALIDANGHEVDDLRSRPRKLALLAYLAIAGRAVPRAQLVELFWGDRDEERARASLSEALSHLRRTLGRDALPAYASDAGLAPGFPLSVDVLDLESAARAGEHDRVLALFRGPFLDGVHIPDAATFERWVERQRGRAADRYTSACAAAAQARLAAGDHEAAARLAGRWLDHQWESADAASILVRALAARGSADSLRRALAAYSRYAQRLADELAATPPPTLVAFAADLEHRLATMQRAPTPEAAMSAAADALVHTPIEVPDVEPMPTPSTMPAPTEAVDMAAASVEPVASDGVSEAPAPDALPSALGRSIASPTEGAAPVRPVPSMAPPARGIGTRRRARRAIDARTLAVVTGAIMVGGVTLRSIGARTAGAAALDPVDGTPAAAFERAALARWASSARDGDGALVLLDSAIARDSTRASAYLLRHRIRRSTGRVTSVDDLRIAARHSDRLDGRARLLALGELALAEDDVRALAIADTLVRSDGDDHETLLLAGRIALQALQLDRADMLARRVLALDSGTPWAGSGGTCWSCEAMELRLHAAWALGDLARCERLATEYVARAGSTPRTLLWQAALAEGNGLWDAADSLYRRSGLAPHGDADDRRVRFAVRAGDHALATRIVRGWATAADPERRVHARFVGALLLREAGRAREGVGPLAGMERSDYGSQLAYGALLLDAGEPRRAAAVFTDAERRWLGDGADSTSPFAARIRTWALAHAATAHAAAGDTAALLPLATRMQVLARPALLGRIPALHHWPRALLWQARGERDSTIAALQRVLVSPTQGHLRAAWLLGRELVAAGRPREARTVIERALLGPTEASGYYVTRRELHEVRAAACAALGDADCVAEERAWARRSSRAALGTARTSDRPVVARR